MAAASLLAPSAGTIGSASLWMRSTGRGAIAPTTPSARPRPRLDSVPRIEIRDARPG